MSHLTLATVRDVAQSVHDGYALPAGDWPDCYDVTKAIQRTLVEDYGVDEDATHVEKYLPPSGYRHYALVLDESVLGEATTIDGSYAQFADGTETVINAGSYEEIGDVAVVQPRSEYLLFSYRTSTGDDWYQ